MPKVDTFSQLTVARDIDGGFFELLRNELEVVCPAFDLARRCMVELHVPHSDDGSGPDPKIFSQQASVASRITHPNISKVFDYGEDEGTCFYVSEFTDGEPLESYIDRCAPLPEPLALGLVLDAARGFLSYSRALPVLAGMDLLQSHVRMECSTARKLTLKVGGYSFGSRKAETLPAARVHEFYVKSLSEVLLWAVTGEQLNVQDLTDEDSAQWSVPALTLLEALDGDRPAIRTLDSAVAAIERTLEAILRDKPDSFRRLSDSLLPLLPLEEYLPDKEDLQLYLNDACTVDGDPFDARTPLRMGTVDTSQNLSGTIQLLPLDDIIPDDIASTWQNALDKNSDTDQPNLIKMLAYWPSEPAGFFIEEDAGQVTLEDLLEWKEKLPPAETIKILEQMETACRQAKADGLRANLRGAGQVVLQFACPPGTRASDLVRKPINQWPAFTVKVRTFPTFLSLLRCPPCLAVPQRGADADEAAAMAWWAQQMVGDRQDIPTSLKTLIDDTIAARAGGIIHTSAEFVQAFSALASNNDTTSILTNRPKAAATDARRMEAIRGRRPLRATHSIEEDELEDEEVPVILPGFAEALLQSPGDAPVPHLTPEHSNNLAKDQLEPAEIDYPELMDEDDYQPASAVWLFLVVIAIALLLAAVFAQLSGNAFWLR